MHRTDIVGHGFARFGLGLLLLLLTAEVSAESFVVIVNNSAHLTAAEVVHIYRSELGGYKPYMLSDEKAQDEFDRHELGMSRQDLKYLQDRALFAGRALPPKILESVQEMLEAVIRTPNGVGYVPSGTVLSGVQVIPMDGGR